MITLFQKLQEFYSSGKRELTKNETSLLGKKVGSRWDLQKERGIVPQEEKYEHQKFTDDSGIRYQVRAYPEHFIEAMDETIAKFYRSIEPPKPKKKKRKRIPLKQK